MPAFAGESYEPIKLKPAQTVTPPPELIAMATEFLEAVKKGNGDAIGAGIAERITTVDGALELAIPRNKEVIGPFKTTEEKLSALGYNTGGDLPVTADGSTPGAFAIGAAREYIVGALTDGQPWGTDPMFKGATCTYAYRSFDQKAVKKLADRFKVQSSGLFYVNAAQPALKAAKDGSEVAGTLQPDLLYLLDYDTDTPINWMAVHLPDGGTGFVNTNKVALEKPYAGGICFAQTKAGWQMVGQASTSL
jgi:hypothetical protein